MTPNHKAMMPASGRAIFMTAISAIWKAPSVTSRKRPVAPPIKTAKVTNASQR